jgi:hypothetical protein
LSVAKRPVRESTVESAINAFAEIRGWWCAKFVSPGLNGVTDRLFIRDGRHVFMEVKRPGEEPTAQQYKRMRDMKAHGAEVHWVDNVEQAKAILR